MEDVLWRRASRANGRPPVIPSSLLEAASSFFGAPLREGGSLGGGYEADVFLVEGDTPAVLHVSPDWRSIAELEWVHSLVERVHEEVSEAVAPIRRKGRTVFEWQKRGAALFPCVSGTPVPRGDPELALGAACLLARIHSALGRLQPEPVPRPRSTVVAPRPSSSQELRDEALDEWWEGLAKSRPRLGVVHGDYYGGNLLAADRQIVAVIDWHEADVRPLALELAGASYEFCRNEEHELDADAVQSFVSTYQANGGAISEREMDWLPEYRAWWVREDAKKALALGTDGDAGYARRQVAAFRRLRGRE